MSAVGFDKGELGEAPFGFLGSSKYVQMTVEVAKLFSGSQRDRWPIPSI
jgi:hypothetical protein